MRPPTGNSITQGKHGRFNAIDYSSSPDPIFYAPEDVTFHAYLLNAGDAGNNLQVNGAHGRHGFAHLEESYIKPGQSKKKGEPLGKMGYTGLTIPKGPGGRHLHWVLLRNGIYVYPPTLITEPFGGSQGGTMVTDKAQLDRLYVAVLGRARGATEGENVYLGKDSGWVFEDLYKSAERQGMLKRKADELSSLRSQVANLTQAVNNLPTGNTATPKQVAAEKAVEALKEALK